VKPNNGTGRAARERGLLTRVGGPAGLALCAVLTTAAQASTVLLADTTLVSGNESSVFSFNAPGPGTVSVELTNLDWPQALSGLSFMATTSSQVLSSWSDSGLSPQLSAFQVGAAGTYFANVVATAGGPLDLGAYSFSLTFTPAGSPVPLPSSGALLLVGMAGLVGLLRWRHAWKPGLVAAVLAASAAASAESVVPTESPLAQGHIFSAGTLTGTPAAIDRLDGLAGRLTLEASAANTVPGQPNMLEAGLFSNRITSGWLLLAALGGLMAAWRGGRPLLQLPPVRAEQPA